jgi:DNA end-binding protein Ku
VEALRVIGVAMAEVGVAGIGRLSLSRRERMVIVEPRGTGMALFTLRAAGEVRPAQFSSAEGELDTEMVAVARAIMARRTGNFDPTAFRDRYQEALRALIETKMKGLPIKPREVITPPPVIDLMAALKRSLAEETARIGAQPPKKSGRATDRRQRSLLLAVPGGRRSKKPATEPSALPVRPRKKA